MTLEELAAATGVPPRTIRYYQAEKLLQKPARDPRDTRVARYGPEHAERLPRLNVERDVRQCPEASGRAIESGFRRSPSDLLPAPRQSIVESIAQRGRVAHAWQAAIALSEPFAFCAPRATSPSGGLKV